MSANAEAHAVAAMGLATMTNGHDANLSLAFKVALHPLVRLGGSPQPDTQTAALGIDARRRPTRRSTWSDRCVTHAARPCGHAGRDNGAPDLHRSR